MKLLLSPIAAILFASVLGAQSNWPQFRGPGGQGVGTGKPPVEFSPEKNVKWKVAVPLGHSSPCLWGDKIFLTGMDGAKLVTFCLDRKDGKELWKVAAPTEKIENAHRIGSPAAPTPCTDGERVYVSFGSFGVLAYDLDGKEVWQKPLPVPVVEFGTSASPIIVDGKVILVVDQDVGSYLLALEAKTGKELWRVDRSEFRRGFSTPFVWEHDGMKELVVCGSLWVRGYDLQDGKQRWSAHGMARVANASPVAVDGVLLVSSWNVGGDEDDRVVMEPFEEFAAANDKDKDGALILAEFPDGKVKQRYSQIDADKDAKVTKAEYETMRSMFAESVNQLFAIRPGGTGDITKTHVVWQTNKHLPYVSSPVAANGRVFTMKSGGLASAYEAKSGSPIYQAERVDASGDYYASGVAVDGRVYVTSQRGTVVVLDTTSDRLNVLARNEMKAPVFASPAIVDGVIYLRTDKELFAFEDANAQTNARPDLQGMVRDLEGKPVQAATVLVESAWVKQGYSPLCPSCYADCAKKTLSDYEGRFLIESLDRHLRFNILVMAPGFVPRLLEKVDPVRSGLAVTLTPRDLAKLPADHAITGLVLDEHGAAVPDALIEPGMFKTDSYHGYSPRIFDPLAITDDKGRFALAANSKIFFSDLIIRARGFAPQAVKEWVPGKPEQTVKLNRGVTVRGRLLLDNMPVPGAAVGLVQVERSISHGYLGEMKVGTDQEGNFSSPNVHGGEDYVIYGIMDSLKHIGAVPERVIKPGEPGTELDVGLLKVEPGRTVRGRVVLSDGAVMRPKQMALLDRDRAWDLQQVEIDSRGGFEFRGIPTGESIGICIRLWGYELSEKNAGLDRLNEGSIIGRIDRDKTDLVVLMEKVSSERDVRRWSFEQLQKGGWNQTEVKQQPLRGTEDFPAASP
jgi:outer membrane protein assembly factor BamB